MYSFLVLKCSRRVSEIILFQYDQVKRLESQSLWEYETKGPQQDTQNISVISFCMIFITGCVTRLTRWMGANSGAETAYPSGTPEFSPRNLVGFVLLDLQFYVYILQIVVCPFVLFLLAIVLSVLRFTDSDYPFGIFKLFLIRQICKNKLQNN